MSKVLFWVGVIVVFMIVVRLMAVHSARRRPPPRRSPRAPRRSPSGPQRMVSCAHCGMHLPANEALTRDGETWCCEVHAELGKPR